MFFIMSWINVKFIFVIQSIGLQTPDLFIMSTLYLLTPVSTMLKESRGSQKADFTLTHILHQKN